MNNNSAPHFSRSVLALALVSLISGVVAFAQQSPKEKGEAELLKRLDAINAVAAPGLAATSPAPTAKNTAPKKSKDDEERKGPTEITATKEATYDEKTRKAVFVGNVVVNDPQITITCDRLTAFLRKEATEAGGGVSPKQSPTAGANASEDERRAGGLESAIAEGTRENPVVIIQEKPASDGGAAQRNVGKAERAEYDAKSGDVKLSGWPQVQQGINLHIATSAETTMTMNRDSHSMRTNGPSKTVIQEKVQPDGKTSQR